MKILHTADWHLGDRMGRIDRTDDLRRAVERVADICHQEAVDVLLVAGDLFSELSRPDALRDSIEHLQATFEKFLLGGGSVVAITGNHDNETFCQTLHLVMTLAAPTASRPGDLCPSGRFYLAANPTFLRLVERQGQQVQFLLLPYPTPPRYLQEEQTQRYASLEEKNRHLMAAYARKVEQFQRDPRFDPSLPTVLTAHIHVQGARLPTLFRISEEESLIFGREHMPESLAYVALGHIHQAHCPTDQRHVRYSGSIERLDLGERHDQKSLVLVEIGPEGRRGEPACVPLPATPIYEVEITRPSEEVPRLRERYPDADRALVRYRLVWKAGVDDREALLRELDAIFPRWYHREVIEASRLREAVAALPGQGAGSFRDSVLRYLEAQLEGDEDRADLLGLAEALLLEETS